MQLLLFLLHLILFNKDVCLKGNVSKAETLKRQEKEKEGTLKESQGIKRFKKHCTRVFSSKLSSAVSV